MILPFARTNTPVPTYNTGGSTRVTDFTFDRGAEIQPSGDGFTKSFAETDLIASRVSTVLAAEAKMAAIQNRADELDAQLSMADSKGNVHFCDLATGERVTVEKQGDTALYSQTLMTTTDGLLHDTAQSYTETYLVNGSDVSLQVVRKDESEWSLGGMALAYKNATASGMTYNRAQHGLEPSDSDHQWRLAK